MKVTMGDWTLALIRTHDGGHLTDQASIDAGEPSRLLDFRQAEEDWELQPSRAMLWS